MRKINVIRKFALQHSETLDRDENGNPIVTDGPGGEVLDPMDTVVRAPALTVNGMVEFLPGVQEVSDAVASHWYTKANSEPVEAAATAGNADALRVQLADMTAERDSLAALLEGAEGTNSTELEALQKRLEDVTAERDKLKADPAPASPKLAETRDELKATKAELEDTKRQLADANAAVDALTAPTTTDETGENGAE